MERLHELPNGWPIWQHINEFKFTLDAVLLAAFPLLNDKFDIVELGSGTGAVSLMMASHSKCKITGVDLNPTVIELFKRSIKENNLTEQVTALHADIKEIKTVLPNEKYALVVSNPPYRKVGHGKVRQGGAESACHETQGQTLDFIKAAYYLLKYSGKFVMVHLPERLPEIMHDCINNGLEPKRLQFVHSKQDKSPYIFLLETMKGGKPGLNILPPVVVYDENGQHTPEILQYY